jgi:hypothetical protein
VAGFQENSNGIFRPWWNSIFMINLIFWNLCFCINVFKNKKTSVETVVVPVLEKGHSIPSYLINPYPANVENRVS